MKFLTGLLQITKTGCNNSAFFISVREYLLQPEYRVTNFGIAIVTIFVTNNVTIAVTIA